MSCVHVFVLQDKAFSSPVKNLQPGMVNECKWLKALSNSLPTEVTDHFSGSGTKQIAFSHRRPSLTGALFRAARPERGRKHPRVTNALTAFGNANTRHPFSTR